MRELVNLSVLLLIPKLIIKKTLFIWDTLLFENISSLGKTFMRKWRE